MRRHHHQVLCCTVHVYASKTFVHSTRLAASDDGLNLQCDISPLLSKRSIRLLDNLSDSVDGTSALAHIITNILWGVVSYKNTPKLKKIKGRIRHQRKKIRSDESMKVRSGTKNVEKKKSLAGKKKSLAGKKKQKPGSVKKTKRKVKNNKLSKIKKTKKKLSLKPKKIRKRKRRDEYKRKLKRLEKAIRKRRMRKLLKKRQKARRKKSRISIKRKKLVVYQDKDFHKARDMNLHPYAFPDLLKKSYRRKIKVIKTQAPPVSEKLDELIVSEMASPEELPILENLTVMPDTAKLHRYENQGFYKLPNVDPSIFEQYLKPNMPTNQKDKPFTEGNNQIVMNVAQGNTPYPNEQDDRSDKPKKNQNHVRFSDVVAIHEPRVSRTHHQPPLTLSEEEDDKEFHRAESDDDEMSNTKLDSSKFTTSQGHTKTNSYSDLSETRHISNDVAIHEPHSSRLHLQPTITVSEEEGDRDYHREESSEEISNTELDSTKFTTLQSRPATELYINSTETYLAGEEWKAVNKAGNMELRGMGPVSFLKEKSSTKFVSPKLMISEPHDTVRRPKTNSYSDLTETNDVAILKPHSSRLYLQPTITVSEEEGDSDYHREESSEEISNTELDSTKFTTLQSRPATELYINSTETYLAGEEWKAVNKAGNMELRGMGPVSFLKEKSSTKFVSPKLMISEPHDTVRRPKTNSYSDLTETNDVAILKPHSSRLYLQPTITVSEEEGDSDYHREESSEEISNTELDSTKFTTLQSRPANELYINSTETNDVAILEPRVSRSHQTPMTLSEGDLHSEQSDDDEMSKTKFYSDLDEAYCFSDDVAILEPHLSRSHQTPMSLSEGDLHREQSDDDGISKTTIDSSKFTTLQKHPKTKFYSDLDEAYCFSDDVAIHEPHLSRPHHQPPMTLSEEEDVYRDKIDDDNDEISSNTELNSTKINKSPRNHETMTYYNLIKTRLDGKEWKEVHKHGNIRLKGAGPVSILKDKSTTKLGTPKLVITEPQDEKVRPAWQKDVVSATSLRDVVKMDFINIIRTYITLSKMKEHDHRDLIELIGHQCFFNPIKNEDKKLNEEKKLKEEKKIEEEKPMNEVSNERKKRSLLKRRNRKLIRARCREKFVPQCYERTIVNIKGVHDLFPISPGVIPGSDVTISSYFSFHPEREILYPNPDLSFYDEYYLDKKAFALSGRNISIYLLIRGIVEKIVKKNIESRKKLEQEHYKKMRRRKKRKLTYRKELNEEESEMEAFPQNYIPKMIEPNVFSSQGKAKEIFPRKMGTAIGNEIIEKKISMEKHPKKNFFQRSSTEMFSSHERDDDLFITEREIRQRVGFGKKSIYDEYSSTLPCFKTFPLMGYDEIDRELYSSEESVSEELDETNLMIETLRPPIRKVSVHTVPSVAQSSVSVPTVVKVMVRHHKDVESMGKQKGRAAGRATPKKRVKRTLGQAELMEIERKKIRERRSRRLKVRLRRRNTHDPLVPNSWSGSKPLCLQTALETVRRPIFDEFGNSTEFHLYPLKVVNSTRCLALELLCKLIHPRMPSNFPAGLIQMICPLMLMKSYAQTAAICLIRTIANHPDTLSSLVYYYDIGYYLCRANNRSLYDISTKDILMGALATLLQKSPLSCKTVARKDIRTNILFWLRRTYPYYYKHPGILFNLQNLFYISRYYLARDYVISKQTVKEIVDVLRNMTILQQFRIYACCVFTCFLFAKKRYRKISYRTKSGLILKTIPLSMFEQPAIAPQSQIQPVSSHKKMHSSLPKVVEEVVKKKKPSEPDAMQYIHEWLNSDIFICLGNQHNDYPYHLFLTFMLTLFARRRPYQGSLFFSKNFEKWKRWLFKHALRMPFGIRCYYAVSKTIPSLTFHLHDCLRNRLNPEETFVVSPLGSPDSHSFVKNVCLNEKKICPSTSLYKINFHEGFRSKYRYKQKVFEQIYDPEMKSLVMPKFYPSVSPYSLFTRTRLNREKYIFYEPLSRDIPSSASDTESEEKPAYEKGAPKPSGNSVVPAVALQTSLYSSTVLYFEMMECYAAIVFRLVERAIVFDLIHKADCKSMFWGVLSSVDIWRSNRLMDVPFHQVIRWYLHINDIDLRFVNKYLSRHCMRMERVISQKTNTSAFPTHPKVLRAEEKFVKSDNPNFSHFRNAARIFSQNDYISKAKRKGFHCYFLTSHQKILKNKRLKNNILSKRFWRTGRRHRYNASLRNLMLKQIFTPKTFLGFIDQKIEISPNSDITRNYPCLIKYLNDLDDYIAISDVELENCPHGRPQERCYNTTKHLVNKISFTFFQLIDKCSRIKEWLLQKYIPELRIFFEMLLELIKIVSCNDEVYKVGEGGDSLSKTQSSSSPSSIMKLESEDFSSSESSSFGNINRCFSQVDDLNETKSERLIAYSIGFDEIKNSYCPSMHLELMNATPILRNEFCFSDLTSFGNAFINRYGNETSDFQGTDFIKCRLPTEIEIKDDYIQDPPKEHRKTKIIRGLSRVIVGKDTTFDKLMAFIRPPLNESSTQTSPMTRLEGRRQSASETDMRTYLKRLMIKKPNNSSIQNDGSRLLSFLSSVDLKTRQTFPDLLDGPSLKISESVTSRHAFLPNTNPIVNYLIYVFSSDMFIKFKELNFLQNYLILGKPLITNFHNVKNSESLLLYKSRSSVIKPVRSSTSERMNKPSIVSIRKSSIENKIDEVFIEPERDMRYYLATHLRYLSCLLRSVVDDELSNAGFNSSDKSFISDHSSSLVSIETVNSNPKKLLSPELYKTLLDPIKPKDLENAIQEEVSSSSSSQQLLLAAQTSIFRKSYSNYGSTTGSIGMRRLPLTMDNVTTFRIEMTTLFDKLRVHILDLLNYPIEKLFTCLADLRLPTLTQLILELYTQSIIPDPVKERKSEETYSTEDPASDDSDTDNNIVIDPSGSVLNIKIKSHSESSESEMVNEEFLEEETEEESKYTIFQRLISESFYCLLPPDFIDAFQNKMEEGAENGVILNPLGINRAYNKALQRYYRQIERLVYHEVPTPKNKYITLYHTDEKKTQKDVYFFEFLLELAQKFVDLIYRCSSCSKFYHCALRLLSRMVCDRLQGPFGYASSHVTHCHRRAVKTIIESTVVPIGELRIGSHLEKAVLFKFLADYFMIPCQLYRVGNLLTWVEVPVHPHHRKEEKYYVVDLFKDPGYLIEKDTEKLKEIFGYQDRTIEPLKENNIAPFIEMWLDKINENEMNLYKKTLKKHKQKFKKGTEKILRHRKKKLGKAEARSQLKKHLEAMFQTRLAILEKYNKKILTNQQTEKPKIEMVRQKTFIQKLDKNKNKLDKRLVTVLKSKGVQGIVNSILVSLFDKQIDIDTINKLVAKYKDKKKKEKREKKEIKEEEYWLDSDRISNISEWSIDEKVKNNEPPLKTQPKMVKVTLPPGPPSPPKCMYKKKKRQKRKKRKNSEERIAEKIRMITTPTKRTKASFFARFNGNHLQFPMNHCEVKKAREKLAWGKTTLLDELSSEVDSYSDSSQEALLHEWNNEHFSFKRSENKKPISMKKYTSNVLKTIPPLSEFFSKPLKDINPLVIILVTEIEKNCVEEVKEMTSQWTQTQSRSRLYFFNDRNRYIGTNKMNSSILANVDDELERRETNESVNVPEKRDDWYSQKFKQIENRRNVTSLKNKLTSLLNIYHKNVQEKLFQRKTGEEKINSSETILAPLEIETEDVEVDPADFIRRFPGVIIVKTGHIPPPVDKLTQTGDSDLEIHKKEFGDDLIDDQTYEKIKNIVKDNSSISSNYEIKLSDINEIPKDLTLSEIFLLDISSVESSSLENRAIKVSKFAEEQLANYITANEVPDYVPDEDDSKIKIPVEEYWPYPDSTPSSSDIYSYYSDSDSCEEESYYELDDSYEVSEVFFKQLTANTKGKGKKPSDEYERNKEIGRSNSFEEWTKLRNKVLYDIFYTIDQDIHNLGELFQEINDCFEEDDMSGLDMVLEEESDENTSNSNSNSTD